MGFTKEEVKKSREKNPQNEATKFALAPVAHPIKSTLSGKGVLKKNEKPKRTYVAVSPVASETEFEEEAGREKKRGESVR